MKAKRSGGGCRYAYLWGRPRRDKPDWSPGVDAVMAEMVVSVVEHAFAVADEQKGTLRSGDNLIDLYRSRYGGGPLERWFTLIPVPDDMELETVANMLSELAGEPFESATGTWTASSAGLPGSTS